MKFKTNTWRKLIYCLFLITFSFTFSSCTSPKPKLKDLNVVKNNTWYKHTDSETVIIFIHGILSDSNSAWRSDEPNHTYWPELISKDSQFDNSSIFLSGYYTAIDSGEYGIENAASEINAALLRKEVLNKKNIIFITHSTGGIIARYLIDRYIDNFSEKNIGLVLIASPSSGSDKANRLSWFSELYGNRLAQQLKEGNEIVGDLDGRFKDLISNRKIKNFQGVEAYENKFIIHNKWWFANKIRVVTKESAGRYFGAPKLLRNTNHFTAVKPTSRDHPAYELVLDFYEQKFKPLISIETTRETTIEVIRSYSGVTDCNSKRSRRTAKSACMEDGNIYAINNNLTLESATLVSFTNDIDRNKNIWTGVRSCTADVKARCQIILR